MLSACADLPTSYTTQTTITNEQGIGYRENYPAYSYPTDRQGNTVGESPKAYERQPSLETKAKPKPVVSSSPRNNKLNKAKVQPKPAVSKKKDSQGVSFTCGTKRTCGQMRSCAEARFFLNQCGVRRLDGDKDGRPCERLCG